jgi:hypothetical protein
MTNECQRNQLNLNSVKQTVSGPWTQRNSPHTTYAFIAFITDIPSRTMASGAFRACASVSEIQAVLAWKPEILGHSNESSNATWSQWWHTCVTLMHLELYSWDQGGSTSATR